MTHHNKLLDRCQHKLAAHNGMIYRVMSIEHSEKNLNKQINIIGLILEEMRYPKNIKFFS